MNKHLITLFFLIVANSLLFVSCSKDPGEGGTASIKGRIYVRDFNSEYTSVHHEYYGADEDVFIIYGDHQGYDDKTTTDYNGYFRFDNLRKGKYTVYIYSDDTTYYTNWSPDNPEITSIVKEVEITENGQEADLDVITIAK